MTRWRILIRTALIVLVIVAAKFLFNYYGWELINLNPLFTSIIAGAVFIIGMILTGTLSDFKETEKVPAEIVNALESIYEEGVQTRKRWPEFDLANLRTMLIQIVRAFHYDLEDSARRTCLDAISRLGDVFTEMETLGLAPNYIIRLKGE